MNHIKYRHLLNLIGGISLSLLIAGCFSIKPQSAKGGKKYFETFFVGEQGTQYFIKPLSFSSDQERDSEIRIDFTFRYKDNVEQPFSMNYSIIHPSKIIKSVDQLEIKGQGQELSFEEHDLLFNEREKDLYESRFKTAGELQPLKELFNAPDWTIEVHTDGKDLKFTSSSREDKARTKLYENIFVLF